MMTAPLLALVLSFNFMVSSASAELISSPDTILKHHFGSAQIQTENVILTEVEATELSKKVDLTFGDRIFTFYVARDESSKIVGYAGLLTRKIRTKDQTALYFISPKGEIEAIELVAFYEPREYKPQAEWLKQFNKKNSASQLKLKNDIRVVTGATLTAQSFVSSSRLVLAVWDSHFRRKN